MTSNRFVRPRHGLLAAGLAATLTATGLLAGPAFASAFTGPAVPSISSITVSGYPQPATPTVTVSGSGFGAAPSGVSPATLANCEYNNTLTGRDYGKSNLWLLDASRSAGLYRAFQEGANFSATNGNCGGIIIDSWTSREVQFTLGTGYQSPLSPGLQSGDTVCVEIKGVPGCLTLS
jgi:hypothetical protein